MWASLLSCPASYKVGKYFRAVPHGTRERERHIVQGSKSGPNSWPPIRINTRVPVICSLDLELLFLLPIATTRTLEKGATGLLFKLSCQ